MGKYIDAERLVAEIERREKSIDECPFIEAELGASIKRDAKIKTFNELISLITSLQQEQPEVKSGKFVFPKYLYARTKDNKTIDVSYAPQDMTAIEYIRNDSIEHEQPEVDLEKEIEACWQNWLSPSNQKEVEGVLPKTEFAFYAHHFWNKGYNARKSIWHNVAEEMPTKNGLEVIVACRNKNKEDGIWLYDLIQCWEGKWEPRVNWETPVKWAYVRDLDNASKEE